MSDKYKANFLWPNAFDGSIDQAGYEFANGITEEYQKQWWEILLARVRAERTTETCEKCGAWERL